MAVTESPSLTPTWAWYQSTVIDLMSARLELASTLRARHDTRMTAYMSSQGDSVAARNRDADVAAAGYEADIIDKQAEIAGLEDLVRLLHDAVTHDVELEGADHGRP